MSVNRAIPSHRSGMKVLCWNDTHQKSKICGAQQRQELCFKSKAQKINFSHLKARNRMRRITLLYFSWEVASPADRGRAKSFSTYHQTASSDPTSVCAMAGALDTYPRRDLAEYF